MVDSKKFTPNKDGVDVSKIPLITLNNGTKMPSIGMGTFGSDNYTPAQIKDAVIFAAECGQRHFDCAVAYRNEKEIGEALKVMMDGGVKREELYITTKVYNESHGAGKVLPSLKQSLSDLGLEYLDLYLIHWPFPNYHPPGCSVDYRGPDAQPFKIENYMTTWKQMEECLKLGLVKSIGVSNMTLPKMELFLPCCEVKPVCNQVEFHPHLQQQELFDYLKKHDVLPVGYSPLGSPKRPARDRTPEDTSDIEDPVVCKVAERLGCSPALVCLKWAIQRGQVPIPFSCTPEKIITNLKCGLPDHLVITDEEMKELSTIDKNCRLIKGQVFLWPSSKGWEDLWDLDGKIAE